MRTPIGGVEWTMPRLNLILMVPLFTALIACSSISYIQTEHVTATIASFPEAQQAQAALSTSDTTFVALYKKMSHGVHPTQQDQEIIDKNIGLTLDRCLTVRKHWPRDELLRYRLDDLAWLLLTDQPYRIVVEPQWIGGKSMALQLSSVNCASWRPAHPEFSDRTYLAGSLPEDGIAHCVLLLQKETLDGGVTTVCRRECTRKVSISDGVTSIMRPRRNEVVDLALSRARVSIIGYNPRFGVLLSCDDLPENSGLTISVRATIRRGEQIFGEFHFLRPAQTIPNDPYYLLFQPGRSDPCKACLPLTLYLSPKECAAALEDVSRPLTCTFEPAPRLALSDFGSTALWSGNAQAASVAVDSAFSKPAR